MISDYSEPPDRFLLGWAVYTLQGAAVRCCCGSGRSARESLPLPILVPMQRDNIHKLTAISITDHWIVVIRNNNICHPL